MVKRGYALDCAHYDFGLYRHFEPEGARDKLIQKPYCNGEPDKSSGGLTPTRVYKYCMNAKR